MRQPPTPDEYRQRRVEQVWAVVVPAGLFGLLVLCGYPTWPVAFAVAGLGIALGIVCRTVLKM